MGEWTPAALERGAVAVVDVAAIEHNTAAMLAHVAGPEVMAVVKADAYGHGLVPAARGALAGGATWLGVALVAEALALRGAGVTAPVLCWLATPGRDWQPAIEQEVDITVGSAGTLTEVGAAAAKLGKAARIQIKIDTGLARNGTTLAVLSELARSVVMARDAGLVEVTGAWSHLACAEELQSPSIRAQLDAYAQALEALRSAGIEIPMRHIANSAAALGRPDCRFDLVRLGITLYGLSCGVDGPQSSLRPAMSLRARLANVKRVPAGTGVSYGHDYVTAADTVLGLVPLGYADGIPRAASNVGPVEMHGKFTHIAGRVCMDQFVLDLGAQSSARLGDEVVLFGAAPHPTADQWAHASGTIGYEIVSRIGARVPRSYVRGGE